MRTRHRNSRSTDLTGTRHSDAVSPAPPQFRAVDHVFSPALTPDVAEHIATHVTPPALVILRGPRPPTLLSAKGHPPMTATTLERPAAPATPISVTGLVDLQDQHGFLRTTGYLPG